MNLIFFIIPTNFPHQLLDTMNTADVEFKLKDLDSNM